MKRMLAACGVFLCLSAGAQPTATRALEGPCASSTQDLVASITVDPGTTPPSSLILEETLPPGWSIVSATWNGENAPPDAVVDATAKWLFGTSRPVAAGVLRYTARPNRAEERSYMLQGLLKFGAGSVRTVAGDAQVVSCDTDRDGLPDDWERRYYDDPVLADPGADDDGDGMSTITEYATRSNPRDADSCLRMTAAAADGADFVLRWWSAAGTTVELMYRASLEEDVEPVSVLQRRHDSDGEQEVRFSLSLMPAGFLHVRTAAR